MKAWADVNSQRGIKISCLLSPQRWNTKNLPSGL